MMAKTQNTKKNKNRLTTWGWLWRLIIALIVPLAVGGLAALIAGDSMAAFDAFKQPPLAPPAWLFPVAWTVLYVLMGVACFLVWIRSNKQLTVKDKSTFFIVYDLQLVFNFFWSIFFFNFEWHLFAFIWLIVLWIMILTLVIWSFKKCYAAAWCLLPYLLWVTFAGYLNIMIAILN